MRLPLRTRLFESTQCAGDSPVERCAHECHNGNHLQSMSHGQHGERCGRLAIKGAWRSVEQRNAHRRPIFFVWFRCVLFPFAVCSLHFSVFSTLCGSPPSTRQSLRRISPVLERSSSESNAESRFSLSNTLPITSGWVTSTAVGVLCAVSSRLCVVVDFARCFRIRNLWCTMLSPIFEQELCWNCQLETLESRAPSCPTM